MNRKRTCTKTEQLQALVDRANRRDLEVEYRPFDGWYVCGEARRPGDDGRDWLGRNFRQAKPALEKLL